jgi:hypothetical protein
MYDLTQDTEKDINSIDSIYYNYLNNIYKLFNKKKFNSRIGSKYNEDSITQMIIFYNKTNETEKYIFDIINRYYIHVTFPLKNSNFFYSTSLESIEDTYNFIKQHI